MYVNSGLQYRKVSTFGNMINTKQNNNTNNSHTTCIHCQKITPINNIISNNSINTNKMINNQNKRNMIDNQNNNQFHNNPYHETEHEYNTDSSTSSDESDEYKEVMSRFENGTLSKIEKVKQDTMDEIVKKFKKSCKKAVKLTFRRRIGQ